jgi:hypothetical protein
MTTIYRNTTSRWNSALIEHAAAEVAAAAVVDLPESATRDQIIGMLYETADALFALAAPTLGDVVRKLTTYWGEKVFDDNTYGADFKRIIIGDIRRIGMQLAGVEEPDASGGMDLKRMATEWAKAIAEFDHWSTLLAEGPSEKWGASQSGDIVAMMDEAEAIALSLPAPHLDAVIKKLAMIWNGDDRFDPSDDAVEHALIMRDLRRFALKHRQ